MGESLD
jgi:hypothetical protein